MTCSTPLFIFRSSTTPPIAASLTLPFAPVETVTLPRKKALFNAVSVYRRRAYLPEMKIAVEIVDPHFNQLLETNDGSKSKRIERRPTA